MLQKERLAAYGVALLVGCASAGCSSAGEAPSASGTATPARLGDASAEPAADGSVGPSDRDASGDAPASGVDRDEDGIPDALEAKYASEYMPFLSIHPSDGCKTHAIVYRVAPHPSEPKRVMMWASVLYDRDCGANGHVGDNEVFGVVLDPTKPAPAGILAVRAISHQGTPCERITTCGVCPGMAACTLAAKNGVQVPIVFASKDKHGGYVSKPTCDSSILCDFGGCALAPQAAASPMINVGEPTRALSRDLTNDGLITQANGFQSKELMHFDPWKPGEFGSAGDVSQDLVDPAFVVDTNACP
jgi:hypothetical protein